MTRWLMVMMGFMMSAAIMMMVNLCVVLMYMGLVIVCAVVVAKLSGG